MSYGTKLGNESLKGSEFAPSLTQPYLGPAKLVSGGPAQIGKDTKYDVIRFIFTALGDGAKGLQYEEVIFEPDSGDDERIDKMRSRVAYILQYFTGEEMALAAVNAADSFEALAANVQKALERAKDVWPEKIVTIKVLGSVYNSKPRLGFPGYKGFIADEESATPLAWSRRELTDNAAYKAAIEAPATAEEEVEGSPVSDANTF